MIMKDHKCLCCGSSSLNELEKFNSLKRVTSDAKLFAHGGNISICNECALIQKYCDKKWLSEIAKIYGSYTTFAINGVSDQLVYDQSTQSMRNRCAVITERLSKQTDLEAAGCILDFGCGRGAMLGAISSLGIDICGYDLDASHLPYLEALPNFRKLFTSRDQIRTERFGGVTMIHSLEHFTDPLAEVELAFDILIENGFLFIQVNDTRKNPFEILVADHLTHFEPSTLCNLVRKAGFEIVFSHNDYIGKEISLLAKKSLTRATNADAKTFDATHSLEAMQQQINWLNQLAKYAKNLAEKPNFGLFGSSIAATWLYGEVKNGVNYFVDEDPSRVGELHLGKPIFLPSQLGSDHTVLIGLIPEVAEQIKNRLKNLPANFETLDWT